ncbi:hypothetical protein KR100_01295 [Synechococcus sp. KORDI-100]|nr:hypothetical protein KR100_01295 [Synechococcus sp. KORDI-100]
MTSLNLFNRHFLWEVDYGTTGCRGQSVWRFCASSLIMNLGNPIEFLLIQVGVKRWESKRFGQIFHRSYGLSYGFYLNMGDTGSFQVNLQLV